MHNNEAASFTLLVIKSGVNFSMGFVLIHYTGSIGLTAVLKKFIFKEVF